MTAVAERPAATVDAAPPDDPQPPTAAGRTGAPAVSWREWVLLGLGAVGLAVAVVATRWGVFTPDTRPDLYQDPSGFLRSTVQAWVGGSTGLGQGNFNAGAAPVGAVVWVIRAVGAEPWLAVRIWRLLLLLVAAWGIRRYLGALLGPRLTVQGRLLATAFFVVNPYVIVAGSTTPILLPYALLPWTMLALLHATREPRSWRWPALFALAFFAQSGLNAGVVPFFQLAAIPAHLVHARWVEGRSWRDLGRVVWRCGVLSVAVSLYWLLPSVLASGTGAGIASSTEDPSDVALTSSYAETARLLGNWPLYGRAGDRLFLGDYTAYVTSAPVVLASFLVPVLAGLALWRSRARERLLVVALLVTALPIMVGIFPPDSSAPAGALLLEAFERIPATIAFRTTNKIGAVVVLAETIALVIGWRAWQLRSRQSRRPVRAVAIVAVTVGLVALSAPLWNGGLYPLGYEIPGTWERATAQLDGVRPDQRVLVVPGGTGGNYRWGMRSPDDLFPSLLDRPVAVRNTVVARGEPAGNFLTWFDTAVAQGAAGERGISTAARYLGAGDVLVRNDLLTEEIGGPAPWVVSQAVAGDADLVDGDAFGERGVDTIPGTSGEPSRRERREDPANSRVHPLRTYEVVDSLPIVRAPAAASQVLVVGDAEAFGPLASAGIVTGEEPVRFLGDLDDEAFATAVADGGRVVITDTNRRRAWDINRTANATSPTLRASEDIDAGSGPTVTRWPDEPDDQTVTEFTRGATIGADRPNFGLQPYGRPANAFDGDPGTAWMTGGFHTAAGDRIWIELAEPQRIESVTIDPMASEPSAVTAVRVRVGDKQVIEAVDAAAGPFEVNIEPTVADRVEVTILDQSAGDNPVGIEEISVEGEVVRTVTRAPETLQRLHDGASEATKGQLSDLPLDVVLTRAQGSRLDPGDDEEAQLDRRFSLPEARTFELTAELAAAGIDPEVLAAARQGERPCLDVAILDDEWVQARIVSDRGEIARGTVRLEGCEAVELDAGEHELHTVFGWRLDQVRLASPGAPAPAAPSESALEVRDRTATSVDLRIGAADGPRYLRLGEAYDERWRLEVDGVDAGPPVLLDGYSVGWRIDEGAHDLRVTFGPQRAVRATFAASAAALVGVTAIAVLPAPSAWRRRDDEADAADEPDEDLP